MRGAKPLAQLKGSKMKVNKTCRVCKEVLPIASFGKKKNQADGHNYHCKPCRSKKSRDDRRTKQGLLTQRYGDMKKRVEGRDSKAVSAVGKPIVSKAEFVSWALNNPDFHWLFRDWEDGGYKLKESPSIDRIDERFGYELFNMQWVTQSENTRRSNIFRNYNKIV